MMELLTEFRGFLQDNLLEEYQVVAEEVYSQLSADIPKKVIICEREPWKFLASFIGVCAAKSHLFLCNPDWGESEWEYVLDLVQPDVIFGDINYSVKSVSQSSNFSHHTPLIMIPTGGTSGNIKFAVHTWETLSSSVKGFGEFFQICQVNSVCVLPLYHVSGLMQFLRVFITRGKLLVVPFKEVVSYQVPNMDFFTSLVPTQLQRLLESSEGIGWLRQFKTVLLGGAPAWDEILEKARFYQIRLAPTYGMTETASQIVTMKPEDFLRGKVGCGQILPHASVIVNQGGSLRVSASSLMLGYYHEYDFSGGKVNDYLQVDDLGCLDAEGYLTVVGRDSDKIITGGENVFAGEVEAAIRNTGMVLDVCVVGVADGYWGEVVTAVYVPKFTDCSGLAGMLRLSRFKVPKFWVAVSSLPRNEGGKVNRRLVVEMVEDNKIF
ncbi:2-succinylbenzoate--CoA ligase [Calothrix sp. PCC 6303]|uniref:2-succinylbenzoate--CoA ligase n=1 Tax=Calothrix sp. PCC 6303 TaxID=1170562 RepID=UPI0002A01AA0|nr:2-succinylbenzoate--CoA ligase [Calothrix sp. PCC 6303]AFZ03383.1 o-succinylbenzoate--CoA ligase [Calothrix sp. PCC 6303]